MEGTICRKNTHFSARNTSMMDGLCHLIILKNFCRKPIVRVAPKKKKKEAAKWYKLNDKKTDVDFIELWEETAWRAVKLTRVAKFRLFFFFSKQHFIFSIINNLSPLLIRMEHQISTWHRASGAPKTFSSTMSLFLVLLYFCNKP